LKSFILFLCSLPSEYSSIVGALTSDNIMTLDEEKATENVTLNQQQQGKVGSTTVNDVS